MLVSVITFADLGKKNNLKTIGILPIIERLQSTGELASVICRINTGFSFGKTKGTISFFLHFLLKALEVLTGKMFYVRTYEERLLDRIAARTKFFADIVLFHPEYFFAKSVLACKKRGITTVALATMAHLETNAALEAQESALIGIEKTNHRVYRELFAANQQLNTFDYIVAFSDFVRDSYIASGFPPERIIVAYSDIDTAAFSIDHVDDGIFRVLYVAHTNLLKGLHYLLEAWESLSFPNSELVIIGQYKAIPRVLKKRYEKIFKRNPSIVVKGALTYQAMVSQYASASAFVLPSLTEGNPKVVMEAMAAGVPVITTTNAKSIIEDGVSGYVVPIRDSNAIKQKLELLYNDQVLRKKIGANARAALAAKPLFGETIYQFCKTIHKNKTI